jgi:hypothetical protein
VISVRLCDFVRRLRDGGTKYINVYPEIRVRVTPEHEKTILDRPCQTNRDLLKGLGKNVPKEHLTQLRKRFFSHHLVFFPGFCAMNRLEASFFFPCEVGMCSMPVESWDQVGNRVDICEVLDDERL